MLIEVPYNYLNLLAFMSLLKFENKRKIDIKTLDEYRKILLDEVIREYKSPDFKFFSREDKWEGEIDFYHDPQDTIDNFLNENLDLFHLEGNSIVINDDITFDDLKNEAKIIRDFEMISNRFQSASHQRRLLDVLGISTIKCILEKYIELEYQIEKAYSKLNQGNKKIEKKIKKLLSFRRNFLNLIATQKEEVADAFRTEAIDNFSELKKEYKKCPIDVDLWKKSAYYDEDLFGDIDSRLYDIFQYAIFGNESLSSEKLQEMLTNFYFNEVYNKKKEETPDYVFLENIDFSSFDDDEDYEENLDDEDDLSYFLVYNDKCDSAFYLTYINKINNYMKKYGENPDLINTKNRLLYALDMPDLNLYDEENFKKALKETTNNDFDEDDYDFIIDEVSFMADEVFITPQNEFTIRKLLFISTYYALTKDKTIVDILMRHFEHDNFSTYMEIIFGDQPGYFKKMVKI